MGLRFDPIGGGQFKQAVKQIIEAESQPIRQLEARKGHEDARLKLFQEFKSKFTGLDKAISDISNFKKFRELKVDYGDGQTLVGATIDKEKAQPGSYLIQIDQLAARTSVISNGFENPDETDLGLGFVVMNLPSGDSKEIFIDDDKASLRGVADAINNSAESPVRAAVVRDASQPDNPWKLIMTAKKDGAEENLDFPDFYFMDGKRDFYVDDSQDAANAVVKIDGFPIELQSNDVPDFLPGVNLHLKQARPDQPFTLTIGEDYQKVSGKVKALVDQVNGILGFITKQNAIDEHSDTKTTFAGDTSLQSIEYRLRNLMHEGFPVGDLSEEEPRLVFLNQIGVEFDKAGQLTFKEEKFQQIAEKDYQGVADAITGSFGFAFQLKDLMKGYTTAGDGMLAIREAGIRERIKSIDKQIDDKTRNVERRTQALTEQFSRLEASLSNLQRQQQSLSATMPSAGGGGNLVQQLLGG